MSNATCTDPINQPTRTGVTMYQFDETEHALEARDFLSAMRDNMDLVGQYRPDVPSEQSTATRLETAGVETDFATVLRIYTARDLASELVDAVLTVSTGVTVIETQGYWRDESGRVIVERAVIVEVVTSTDHERETITKFADSIGAKYGETEILLTTGAVISETLYCS